MSTLPLLRVKTAHSEYVIDQESGTFTRQTVHEDANQIRDLSAGEQHEYAKVYGPVVGEPLTIALSNGRFLRSTRVQSVEEL